MKVNVFFVVFVALSLTACGDRVGSEKWCGKLKEKPKSDWTMEEAMTFVISAGAVTPEKIRFSRKPAARDEKPENTQ